MIILEQIKLTLSNKIFPLSNINNVWFWFTIIEFGIIAFLGYKLFRNKRKYAISKTSREMIEEARRTDIDMSELMESINKSKDLYKKLSSLCHPDRFVNTTKQKSAENIFQEISENKRNFKELSRLSERARKELEIEI